MRIIAVFLFICFSLPSLAAATYYIDSEDGNDLSGMGTVSSPWQSLDKALLFASSGDTILLENGNYGVFEERIPRGRTGWVTVQALNKGQAVFSKINIKYDTLNDAYLLFDGLSIETEWVDPASSGYVGADDPYYSDSGYTTYKKTSVVVAITNVKNIKLVRCQLEGTNKYLTPYGISIYDSENVFVENCIISKTTTPLIVSNSRSTNIIGNILKEMTSSAIRLEKDNTETLISRNNVYDSNWDYSDPYCPRAQALHGSAIAFRCCDVSVQKNIFHNGWNSSGFMLYTDADIVYSDILIENNLMYDIHNNYLVRLYNVGDGILLRNNTFIGKYRDTTFGGYIYESGITLHSLAAGYDGSGIEIYNNIIVASVSFFSEVVKVQEGNNIIWSFLVDGDFKSAEELSSTSKIITSSSYYPLYFEEGFFIDTPTFIPNHGREIDFHTVESSDAQNFGKVTMQPEDSLGMIDPSGFILDNGKMRSSIFRSAGCYEYDTSEQQGILSNMRVLF